MAQVLRATKVWNSDPVASSKRARYTAGSVNGREFVAYAKEEGVDPKRKTETLAEVTVGVENWRWSGVPFILRSGKAISGASKGILVTFKDVPHLPVGLKGKATPSTLSIGLNPESLALDLNINGAGSPFELDRVVLEAQFARGELDAYGEVLDGILDGDPTLSVRGDVAEECWRIVEPVLAAWRKDKVRLETYPAGSGGPAAWQRNRRSAPATAEVDGKRAPRAAGKQP
jgi:glucose-6-phosphate 1-dehydrogenase